MRILFVTAGREHSHDYLSDFIWEGFCTLFGNANVVDWPSVDHLHLASDLSKVDSRIPKKGSRDACNLDCDQAWPKHDLSEDEIFTELREGKFDLIVGSTHGYDNYVRAVQQNAKGAPCALIDGTDSAQCFSKDKHGVYFKRELPIGANWAVPLPLTYPTRRRPLVPEKRSGVIYYATTHGGSAIPRLIIREDLLALKSSGYSVDVLMTDGQHDRPSPEELHEKMWRSLVGVHWNPTKPMRQYVEGHSSGWDGNRYSESYAFSLALVSQRPFIQYPYPYEHRKHVVFVDDPGQVAGEVQSLLDNPEKAVEMGERGHQHWFKYHSSPARAKWVLKHCGFSGYELA